ncbi:DUF4397 domain-containing protein [Natronomonas sp.]|uniref:DUF4397 domain-containing protein n=1 Tax=Natronomonas sp. TaxID=2184060 RepID=UPI002FC38D58
MQPTRRTVLKTIGGGSAVLLAGSAPAAAGGHEAKLRVAHASPDAPNVDIYVDGMAVIKDLPFGEVTGYLEVPADEYTIAVKPAGGDKAVFGPVDVVLEAEDYTAVALGELDDESFTVSLLEDTNGANLDGEARVRAVHASPDAGPVDVTVNEGALTVFDGIEFGDSPYATVPVGQYTVEVRPDTDDGPVVDSFTLEFEENYTYTAFAVGYVTPDDDAGDEAFMLVPTVDATAPPRGGGKGRGRGQGRGRGP